MKQTITILGIDIPIGPTLLLICSALVASVMSFVTLDDAQKVSLFVDYSYYIITIAFLLSLTFMAKPMLQAIGTVNWQKSDGYAIVLLMVIFGILFTAEENCFKIVLDEVVLLATSKSLAIEAVPTWPVYGYWFDGQFIEGLQKVDKRPILYPLLVSITHNLFGFSRDNAFWLNNVLSGALLLLFYTFVRRYASVLAAFAASLLLLALPEFTITGNGGGFGILNLLVILAAMYASSIYMRAPTQEHLNALAFTGALLSTIRPESVMLIPGVAVIIIFASLHKQTLPITYFASMTPWVCAMYVFQKSVFNIRPNLWQDKGPHGLLSPHYFIENLILNLKYFFDLGFNSSNSLSWVMLITISVIGLFLLCLKKKEILDLKPEAITLLVFAVIVGSQLLLFHFYYAGHFHKPTRGRYTLPMCMLGCMLVAYFLTKEKKHSNLLYISFLVTITAELSLSTLPAVINEWRAKYAVIENWKCDFIMRHIDEHFLVIGAYKPLLFISYEKAATPLSITASRLQQIKYLMEIKYFDAVYFIHSDTQNYEASQQEAYAKLNTVLKLEHYEQSPFSSKYAISRVNDIQVEPLFPHQENLLHVGPDSTHELSDEMRTRILNCFPVWNVR